MPKARPASDFQGKARFLAEELVKKLSVRKEMVAAAESCTAGLASDFIARIPGASDVFWGSFVTYTAEAKTGMLGIPDGLIKKEGAVSRLVALAMAEKALEKSRASWAFSVTGLAGPGGDGSETAVGTIWVGIAQRQFFGQDGNSQSLIISGAKMFFFSGSRNEIREAAAAAAFQELLEKIGKEPNPGLDL